jgi:hypothetical protein
VLAENDLVDPLIGECFDFRLLHVREHFLYANHAVSRLIESTASVEPAALHKEERQQTQPAVRSGE